MLWVIYDNKRKEVIYGKIGKRYECTRFYTKGPE